MVSKKSFDEEVFENFILSRHLLEFLYWGHISFLRDNMVLNVVYFPIFKQVFKYFCNL